MKFAIPTEDGLLCPHFGHSPLFTIVDVTPNGKEIASVETLVPPPHDKGVLPAWLKELNCTHVIAGGMGGRAVMLFEQSGIQVISGAPVMAPRDIVEVFLNGQLAANGNPCNDPSFHHGHGHGQCSSHDDH
ncbi:MAG: NifB/NifX family molybdenum-iron cluster-binding protein [Candidatus Zixiibacteriota bacterium]